MNDQWFVELNDDEQSTSSFDKINNIAKRAEEMVSGRLWVGKDGGPRPWWHRLLGLQNRYVDSLFALEWHEQIASLIFHDENWSEYRAIDKERPVNADEALRKKIAHGEVRPHPIEECMSKERAFSAANEYLKNSNRPKWLEYHFVE